ncbi:hypothetical protein OGAPHI_006449 [Ogataea philodendri]|uniref:Mannosyltransferase n=1 Tax=Ogataea philodendri TaxID=1378263 RepID=A0A9P8NYJ7_9ASCO|nr:uncharacterized protein OGAPHI_006449 [Ogataea philodendri]KAH3661601.1 hypothetical protein OGAPHI_006449 [Ogataea philodendri]
MLHYRFKIHRRVLVQRWIPIFLILLGLCFTIRYLNTGSYDIERLKGYEFEDRFSKKALKLAPMSEREINSDTDAVFVSGCRDPKVEAKNARMNAAFVVLARNSEVDGVVSSMKSLERHFNQWFNYPWIFLNNERFSHEFKKRVSEVSSGPVRFGVVTPPKWNFKEQKSDPVYFKEAVESQGDRCIMYGNTASYHNMCRFYSGFFFNHPLVKKLDYYWRVEPDVDFYCDLTYDPFLEMSKNNKQYGFTIAIKELVNTVPNLFRYTKAFIREYDIQLPDAWSFVAERHNVFHGQNSKHYASVTNRKEFWKKLEERVPMYEALKLSHKNLDLIDQHSLDKLVDHSNKRGLLAAAKNQFDGSRYNLCHFWSNFEIARTDLFTSEQYRQYFDFLESSQGFFVERWGDAPIHSLAAGMFLNLSNIHYFRDIGYKHSTLGHCPKNSPNQLPYEEGERYKKVYHSLDEEYWAKADAPAINGAGHGCRCRCPSDHEEIENSGGSCIAQWAKLTDDERMKKGSVLENDIILDLDAIEKRAVQFYEEHLAAHKGDGSKWKLTAANIKELEKLQIKGGVRDS